MDDHYFTIGQSARVELKEKASRFIGETFLVTNQNEAQAMIGVVKKREFSASHHCTAWIIGLPGSEKFKYSDDGEPKGTAGKPIYDVLTGHGLMNTLLVVTRYFGGTKLGTGPLARAYSETAKLALEQSGRKEQFVLEQFRLILEFSLYDRWLKLAPKLEVNILDSEFSENVSMKVSIRKSRSNDLRLAFTELTAGKGTLEAIE
ncbi:MAG: YigZ family protein [candidate division Zixibacteria bacterium]|nr:YigZ family protein [candidate division Zixibacteria bacterium]